MPLTVEDYGSGNRIEIGRAEHAALHGHITFTGDDALVTIGPASLDTGLRIEAASHARIHIGAGNHLGHLFIHAAPGTTTTIGDRNGFNGLVRLLLHEPGRLTIGSACLFAADTEITISDMHPIFDAATGQRINPAADVAIADRVWIGARSLILKGTTIGADTVIGAASLVSGPIPPACIAAGNPARVLREGVRWAMDLP